MTGAIHALTMPKWGIEMQEGTVTAWHIEPGQAVRKGDALLDVETDKIVNSVEAPVSGVLRRILGAPGEVHAVGALIGVFAGSEVPDAEVEAFIEAFRPADTSFEPAPGPVATHAARPGGSPAHGVDGTDQDTESRASPIARRLAEQLGVDLARVRGTGRNGRISKEDVEAFVAAQAPAAAPRPHAGGGNPATREKLTPMRSTIARRLVDSKQRIPHYRLSVDVDAGALLAHRRSLQADGSAATINDLIVRAVALALVEHPQVNAHLDGDEIVRFQDADVCIAVATDAGLVTPVLRGANRMPVARICAESAALAELARTGKLTREQITGGTFTVSNLGMFGLARFDAIINPPQVAILAVGAVRDAVVARDGRPEIARLMTLTLSCDHRVVDGSVGAAFLGTLRALLECPDRL